MKRDINRFDTSDYAVDDGYSILLSNKKVPSLMKDENNACAIMTEFVGHRAKMYALRGKKHTKKAKGKVKSNVVAKSITFDDYMRCLFDKTEMTQKQSCIKSKLHLKYIRYPKQKTL